jgi:hypothetical protein
VRALLIPLVGLIVACSPTTPAIVTTPTPRPPTAVPTPRPPTATPTPNYRELRTRLVTPLGALIIAVRGNDRSQAAAHLAQFNQVADEILPRIDSDMSKEANALHSVIINVRSHPGNLAALEDDRRSLLAAIP